MQVEVMSVYKLRQWVGSSYTVYKEIKCCIHYDARKSDVLTLSVEK